MPRIAAPKIWIATFVCLSLVLISGCNKMSGKYSDSSGMLSVEFKSSKAYVTTAGTTQEVDYDVDGDKVTLKNPQGNLVLTKNSDGSLTGGPLGEKLTKQ